MSLKLVTILLIVSFVVQSFLIWCSPTCLFLVLLLVILMLYPKYYCQTLTSRRFLFMSSSRSFTLSSLRNRVFPAILVNKDVTVTSNCSHHGCWAGEPWGSSGRKEHLPSSSHQTAAALHGESWGHSGWENTGYWLQVAEVCIKGMTSVSSDSSILPYIEKH